MTNPYDYFEAAPVNNAGLDPISGFDVEVWVQDTVSGKIAIFGRFQTITLSVRDATETYISLGERIPTYLNGEIQVAWVLEQGLIDMNFLNRTFGVSEMSRAGHISRGPRFHISFDVDAAELDAASSDQNTSSNSSTSITALQARASTVNQDSNALQFNSSSYGTRSNSSSNSAFPSRRRAKGRIELQRCKVDSISMGAMSGRRVAALRWEGVAEGWRTIQSSIQTFKDNAVSNIDTSGLNSHSAFDVSNIQTTSTLGQALSNA